MVDIKVRHDKEGRYVPQDLETATSSEEVLSTEGGKRLWRRCAGVLVLGFNSLGSIYGDIGTSPLYVMTTLFDGSVEVTENNILGVLSCIFWVFTCIAICKYCFIVLAIGPNNGEGGQIAVYCKIARELRTGPKGVLLPGGNKRRDELKLFKRSETIESTVETKALNKRKLSVLNNRYGRRGFSVVTLLMCLLGCALVMSDGLLTPTTSVLSAIEGIATAKPEFSSKVLPVSICVLLLLFSLQPFGTRVISAMFSPVIFVWFVVICIIGIINVTKHPIVFSAINPAHAVRFLSKHGISALGSAMLCITGAEAMFADVGHFTPLSVQLTLSCFVYPCLMLTYLGQGSYLISHSSAVSNVFYLSIPGDTGTPIYWFVFTISTLATMFASQSLILGVFSILQQMTQIDCFPKIRVIHKSATHHGRVYLPTINIILMIAVILTCAGFKTSSNVTAAYGLGVSLDIFVTTNFIALCMVVVYELHWSIALLYYFSFGTLELILVIANMKKIPNGAWFTIIMAAVGTLFFCFWRWGRGLMINYEAKGRVRIDQFTVSRKLQRVGGGGDLQLGQQCEENLVSGEADMMMIKGTSEEAVQLSRYRGLGLLYTDYVPLLKSPNTIPRLFSDLVRFFPGVPDLFVFIATRIASVPYVSHEDRLMVELVRGMPGFYRCVVNFGFMDNPKITKLEISQLLQEIDAIDPTRYYSMLGSMPKESLPILQIFGVDSIKGNQAEKWQGIAFVKHPASFAKFCYEKLRNTALEALFAPLNSLQARPDSLTDPKSTGGDIAYFGRTLVL